MKKPSKNNPKQKSKDKSPYIFLHLWEDSGRVRLHHLLSLTQLSLSIRAVAKECGKDSNEIDSVVRRAVNWMAGFLDPKTEIRGAVLTLPCDYGSVLVVELYQTLATHLEHVAVVDTPALPAPPTDPAADPLRDDG